MDQPKPLHRPPAGSVAAVVCVALLILFATIAWQAGATKSPAFDEPYHAISAWTNLRYFDYRIDCEDPPLWKYWGALPNGKDALSADFSSDTWKNQPTNMQLQWKWMAQTLYQTLANTTSDEFVRRSRAMMLVFGPLLGGLIGWWAWRIGGSIAAIAATVLFCFDPNFLAHAPLMKNDVVFTLAFFSLVYNLWRAGQRLTYPRAIAIALLCGVMLTVKFSGPLAGILIPTMLGIRALLPATWPAFGRSRTTRLWRLIVAAAVTIFAGVVGITCIWAAYGFRFDPTPDPDVRLNTPELIQLAGEKEVAIRRGDLNFHSSAPDAPQTKPSLFVRTLSVADRHHLLPQAWIAGLLFTYETSLIRQAFLLDQFSYTGWRYYFPVAMLVKTPLATLAAAVLAILMIVRLRPRSWTTLSLLVPFLIYFQSAIMSNMNVGLRHVLPLYPLIFVAIGWAAAKAWQRWRKGATVILIMLATALTAESLSAYPNFIPFFNVIAARGSGGLHLLGDSNLDWGQDLPLLKQWQQDHPQTPLYLSYFGSADPAYYGIKYIPLPGKDGSALPHGPSVLAVSATNLQGLYLDPNLFEKFYQPLAHRPPDKILGGSIYLYDYSKVADLIDAQGR